MDDSYSFTYTLSQKNLNSRSNNSLTTPRNVPPSQTDSKNPTRLVLKSNQGEYQPKFLTGRKFLKNKGNSSAKKQRQTWTVGRPQPKPRSDRKLTANPSLVRKSAYSKILQKNHEKLFQSERRLKKEKGQHSEVVRELMDQKSRLFEPKKDSFVQKSISRLSHLEDLRDVIIKSKKAVHKSRRKEAPLTPEETRKIRIRRVQPQKSASKLFSSLGFKSNNSSIKLRRKKKLHVGQGLSLSLYSRKKNEGSREIQMADYFAKVHIKNKRKSHLPQNNRNLVNKEYFEGGFANGQSIDPGSKYHTPGKRTKKGSALKRDKRTLEKNTSFKLRQEYSGLSSQQVSVQNQVSISRTSQKEKDHFFVPMHFSEGKIKTRNKFKITSLAQLLQRRVPQKTKGKDQKLKMEGKKSKKSKKSKNFRITSKLNKTAKPLYPRQDQKMGNYLQISTIKPFEPFQSTNTNRRKKGRRGSQGDWSFLPNSKPGKMEKKRLESYGFIDFQADPKAGGFSNRKKGDTRPLEMSSEIQRKTPSKKRATLKDKKKTHALRSPMKYKGSPEPQFKFVSSKLSNRYKENLSSMKKKESRRKQNIIRHVNDLKVRGSNKSNRKRSKSPLKSFKMLLFFRIILN